MWLRRWRVCLQYIPCHLWEISRIDQHGECVSAKNHSTLASVQNGGELWAHTSTVGSGDEGCLHPWTSWFLWAVSLAQEPGPFPSRAIHKSFVEVNEEDTEGAAATGVTIIPLCLHIPYEVRIVHSFLFLIKHNLSKSILFFGWCCRPPPPPEVRAGSTSFFPNRAQYCSRKE